MFDACVALCKRVYLPRRQGDKAAECLKIMERVAPGMYDPGSRRRHELYAIGEECHPAAPALRGLVSLAGSRPGMAYEQLVAMGRPSLAAHNIVARLLTVCAASDECFTSRGYNAMLFNHYLRLEPERPGLVHSQMLGHAIERAQWLPEFDFTAFFEGWGPENFRAEDCGSEEGPLKSLWGQCATLIAVQGRLDAYAPFINRSPAGLEAATDLLCEALFRHLQTVGKRLKFSELWRQLIDGCRALEDAPPTHWHKALFEMAELLAAADPESARLEEMPKRPGREATHP